MAGQRQLTGNYAVDYTIIQEVINDLTTNIRTENLGGEVIEHTFSGTTEEAISHKLERVPQTFSIRDQDDHASVVRGSTAWDKTTIYLKTDVFPLTIKVFIE